MSQFTLSRDTDWSELMQFISDNRETFDYSRKDLNTIAKKVNLFFEKAGISVYRLY